MTEKQKQVLKDKLQHYLDDFEHWCSRDDRYEKPCVWFETITRGNKVYFINEFLFDVHAINVDEYLANYDKVDKILSEFETTSYCKLCRYECEKAGGNKK